MSIVLSALRTEIDTDPSALGYSGLEHVSIAALMNDPAQISATLSITFITAASIHAVVVGSEFAALNTTQQLLWIALTKQDSIPIGGPGVNKIKSQITTVWSAGTETRGNLSSLQTRPASRAEVLFGEGSVVRHQDVAAALALPSA